MTAQACQAVAVAPVALNDPTTVSGGHSIIRGARHLSKPRLADKRRLHSFALCS